MIITYPDKFTRVFEAAVLNGLVENKNAESGLHNYFFNEWLRNNITPLANEENWEKLYDEYCTTKNFNLYLKQYYRNNKKLEKSWHNEARARRKEVGLPVDSAFQTHWNQYWKFWIGLLIPTVISIIALFQSSKDLKKDSDFIQLNNKVDSLQKVQTH